MYDCSCTLLIILLIYITSTVLTYSTHQWLKTDYTNDKDDDILLFFKVSKKHRSRSTDSSVDSASSARAP